MVLMQCFFGTSIEIWFRIWLCQWGWKACSFNKGAPSILSCISGFRSNFGSSGAGFRSSSKGRVLVQLPEGSEGFSARVQVRARGAQAPSCGRFRTPDSSGSVPFKSSSGGFRRRVYRSRSGRFGADTEVSFQKGCGAEFRALVPKPSVEQVLAQKVPAQMPRFRKVQAQILGWGPGRFRRRRFRRRYCGQVPEGSGAENVCSKKRSV